MQHITDRHGMLIAAYPAEKLSCVITIALSCSQKAQQKE
jgi:hypothetical protein